MFGKVIRYNEYIDHYEYHDLSFYLIEYSVDKANLIDYLPNTPKTYSITDVDTNETTEYPVTGMAIRISISLDSLLKFKDIRLSDIHVELTSELFMHDIYVQGSPVIQKDGDDTIMEWEEIHLDRDELIELLKTR